MNTAFRKICGLLLCVALFMPATALAVDVELPILPEKETFTIMIVKDPLSLNNMAEKECVAWTEEQTNIRIDWIEVPGSSWTEKVNIMFAAGDLPDAIIGGVDVVQNCEVLVPLNEYIERCAPNVQLMFEEVPTMKGALTIADGNIYSLPTGDAGNIGDISDAMWINKTWLDALDLPIPTTTQELYDVLLAFRDRDPNGNGEADELPLMACSSGENNSSLQSLYGAFGTLDNETYLRVDDGKVIFTPSEQSYYDALTWLHELYAQSLLNQEYFTESFQQFQAKMVTQLPVAGLVFAWHPDVTVSSAHVADYAVLPPVSAEGVEHPLWNSGAQPGGMLNGFVITTACKNPEALIRWYDYVNSDLDVQMLWNFGKEGLAWYYTESGKWTQTTDNVPDGSSFAEMRRTWGVGPSSPIYAYDRFSGLEVREFADRMLQKYDANQVYAPFVPAEIIPKGFDSPENESERGLLLVDIDNYMKKFKADAIVSGLTQTQWEAHLNTLEGLNVPLYVSLWQSFYDTHK